MDEKEEEGTKMELEICPEIIQQNHKWEFG